MRIYCPIYIHTYIYILYMNLYIHRMMKAILHCGGFVSLCGSLLFPTNPIALGSLKFFFTLSSSNLATFFHHIISNTLEAIINISYVINGLRDRARELHTYISYTHTICLYRNLGKR